jgi:hypothetical protein
MSAVKLIAAFSENKPGYAARITEALACASVNIRWVTIASLGGIGVMKLLVDKCDEAMVCLRSKGVTVNLIDAIAVEVTDKPGSLNAVCECLAKNSVNLENTSGFVANHRAIVVIETHDLDRAIAALNKSGQKLLSQQEILSL